MRRLLFRVADWYFRIPVGDELYRHVFAPLSISKRKGVLVDRFWNLDSTRPDMIEGSVAWSRLLPTSALVHGYGCKRAQVRNDRLKEREKFNPQNRSVYCGVYAFSAFSVRNLPRVANCPEILSANVVYKIEEGDIAHAALAVRIVDGVADVEEVKTIIVDRLWRAARGPTKHVCDCDREIVDHPSDWIKDASSGDAVIDPPFLQRWIQNIRFRVESRVLDILERKNFHEHQAENYLAGW